MPVNVFAIHLMSITQQLTLVCPFGSTRSGNTCVCNSPFTYNSGSNTCECSNTCPLNAKRSSNCGCVCDSPYVYNSGSNTCDCASTRQCPSNGYRNSTCDCVCYSPYVYNSGANTCEIPLQCPFGSTRSGNTCVCNSPFTYNSGSNTCDLPLQCPFNSRQSGNTCVCNSPFTYNSGSNTCECTKTCPSNSQINNRCECECNSPNAYNSATNTCDRVFCNLACTSPQQPDASCSFCESQQCSVACPSGSIQNMDCSCTCAVGYEFNQTLQQCVSVTKYSVCKASEYSCENNQVAYKDCNGRCFCACGTGFAGPRCEIVVKADLCDNCFYDNGHYHAGVAEHCDLYVNCIPNGVILRNNSRPDSFTPFVMSCPPGTYYITRPSGWRGCDHLQNGICSADKCQTLQPNAKYADSASCQSYWQCGPERQLASKGCCPAGQAFDERSQTCVASNTCQVSCGPQAATGCNSTTATPATNTCPFDVTANNPNEYFYKEVPWAKSNCLPGDIMDLNVCRCVRGFPSKVTGCNPAVDINFESTTNSDEDSVPRSQIPGVGQVGNFSGNQDLILKYFAGSGFYTDYFQINLKLYLPTPPSGSQRIAVVTNADCNRKESVSITMDNRNFYFKIYQLDINEAAEIVIPYSGLADSKGWYDISLIYQKIKNNFEFTGKVGSVTQKYQGNVNLTAYIDMRTCALHLGYGFNYSSLVGYVDNFQVWRCNPSNFP
ncbi:hypothetical protein Btru_074528 [Bulinus truncatus]|nr:hypothetical protein Btru_074528 [Bulinus truncatus]